MKNNNLERIIKGENIEELIEICIEKLYYTGPIDAGIVETLSLIKYHHDEIFQKYEDDIVLNMGLFYKDAKAKSLKAEILNINKSIIKGVMLKDFTPVQVEMLQKSDKNRIFSFSSGTSVGKSFVFRELLNTYKNDVIVIVPSRALINEYIMLLEEVLDLKEVNLLQHVDFINRKKAKRNIFILTPERAKSVFFEKKLFKLDIILFDEAQLANEKNNRGVLFDGIVRRFNKEFPFAKIIFAHPFIENPEAQIQRNHLEKSIFESIVYYHKNVGQIFISYENNTYFQFALDKEKLSNNKEIINFNPIERVLSSDRSMLIYMSKAKIYRKEYIGLLNKYRRFFKKSKDQACMKIIEDVQDMLGVSKVKESYLLRLMEYGIVLHHGSMPLELRRKIEEFINRGFSKVCIATSTLYQGINMPFDLVWVDKLEKSKSLDVKNLIGRAGRSTNQNKFDFGIVLIKDQRKSDFRDLMKKTESIENISNIETDFGKNEIDVIELKEAIKNNSFSDKYNLTLNEVRQLSSVDLYPNIKNLLDCLFIGKEIMKYEDFKSLDTDGKMEIKHQFAKIYIYHLRRKELSDAEKDVLIEGLQIMIWMLLGKSFKQVVALRYFFTTKFFNENVQRLRKKIEMSSFEEKDSLQKELYNIKADYHVGYNSIPDIKLKRYPMFKSDVSILDVDYDRIIFDTYDYIDKLISLKLKDVFNAAFMEYYAETDDSRAFILSNLIKYGTNDPKRIWLLRYGFSNEDIDSVIRYVKKINYNEIIFDDRIKHLDLNIPYLSRYL